MEEMSLGWCNFELKLSGASQTKKLVTLFVARASSAHANLKRAFTGEGIKEVMAWAAHLEDGKASAARCTRDEDLLWDVDEHRQSKGGTALISPLDALRRAKRHSRP